MATARLVRLVVGAALMLAVLTIGTYWMVFRVVVPPDKCLVLIRKSGAPLLPGQNIAGPGQQGIQFETLGPGRYFLNPLTWDHELHDLIEVSAGDPSSWEDEEDLDNPDYQHASTRGQWPEVGVLVNRVGKAAPAGSGEIVGPSEQGIQLDVLTPGTYRINPYAYEVRKERATVIPLGYAGIVTSQVGAIAPGVPASASAPSDGFAPGPLVERGQRGVLKQVLQPGIYYLNPYAFKVQVIWIGYNLMSQVKATEAAEQITFPSKDGFTIDVDVTVVWGLHPAHSPALISGIGDADRIRQIILNQMRSICRNVGSDYVSTDFIQGEKRELYQRQVTDTLRRVCEDRDIEVLIALIHNIEVRGGSDAKVTDSDLKRTIQRGFIAREQDLTKQKQRESAKVLAELEAARAEIPVARQKVSSDTRLRVAGVRAEGRKKAEEIDAQRELEVAQIEREISTLDAETKRVLGRASSHVSELKNQAEADGKRMMVEALGTGRAYNLYMFAQSFEPQQVNLFFAGPGTFWTDLTRIQDAAGLQMLEKGLGGPPPSASRPAR